MTEYPGFKLFNVYFPKAYGPKEVADLRKAGDPNADKIAGRMPFKLSFYDTFLEHIDSLKAKGDKLVICGDFNVAHQEIDLARPKANKDTSGFLPEERAWMDKLVKHGYIDTFRHFNKEPGHYQLVELPFQGPGQECRLAPGLFLYLRQFARISIRSLHLEGCTGFGPLPGGYNLENWLSKS